MKDRHRGRSKRQLTLNNLRKIVLWRFCVNPFNDHDVECRTGLIGVKRGRRSGGKILPVCLVQFVVPLHFLARQVQFVVLVSILAMVSTDWSVSCLLFFYSRCSRAHRFVKVRGRVSSRAPWSRRHRFCLCRSEISTRAEMSFSQRSQMSNRRRIQDFRMGDIWTLDPMYSIPVNRHVNASLFWLQVM